MIPSDGKAREASLGHVNDTLLEEVTLYRKRFREVVSLDVSRGIVAAITFNAPTKPPGRIYVEKTPKQCGLGCCNS